MNDLQIFENPEFGSVRVIEKDGEEWFVGTDIAKALGYSKPQDAVSKHVDKDDSAFWGVIDSMGRTQQTKIINESGMYSLIILSELQSARKFKRWITSEVLPSIRKTGGYNIPQLSQSELILQIAQNNVELERKMKAIEEKTNAVEGKLENALDVFTTVPADNWKDETNRIINKMCEAYKLNYQTFKHTMYDELESVAQCNLAQRQTNLRSRMTKAGATYAERQAISKIDIIDRDNKLKAIFDGIVRKYMAKYIISPTDNYTY